MCVQGGFGSRDRFFRRKDCVTPHTAAFRKRCRTYLHHSFLLDATPRSLRRESPFFLPDEEVDTPLPLPVQNLESNHWRDSQSASWMTKSATPTLARSRSWAGASCGLLAYYIGTPWRWFSWHPLMMMLAFIAAAGSGILTKHKGGRENTITHGGCMIIALVLSLGGWYVIYQQKIMLGKPHNTSWHALLGLVAIGGYALGALSGATALHPDWGVAKTVQPVRLAHKFVARASSLSAFAAIGTGWYKLGGAATTAALLAALALLAWRLRLVGGKAGGMPGLEAEQVRTGMASTAGASQMRCPRGVFRWRSIEYDQRHLVTSAEESTPPCSP